MSENTQVETPVIENVVVENEEIMEGNEGNEEQTTSSPSEEKLEKLEAEDTSNMSKSEKKVHKKQLEKFKLKVYGKEIEEEIDLGDKEKLTRMFQKAHAADRQMQESSDLRKSAEQFIDMLRTNPRKVLSDPNIGVDMKKFVQEYLDEQIENSTKSPEQLALEKAQKELEEFREKYKTEEEKRKSDQLAKMQDEHEEKVQTDIESALKGSELPKTAYTVRKMAEMMIQALENDIELSPKDLVPLIRKQMQHDIKELFSSSSDDVLEEMLGKDNISRIRKRNIAKVKQQQQVAQTANSVKPTGTKVEAPKKEEAKMTIRDFLKV